MPNTIGIHGTNEFNLYPIDNVLSSVVQVSYPDFTCFLSQPLFKSFRVNHVFSIEVQPHNSELQFAELQFAKLQFTKLQFVKLQFAKLQFACSQSVTDSQLQEVHSLLQSLFCFPSTIETQPHNSELQFVELQFAKLQFTKLQFVKLQFAKLQFACSQSVADFTELSQEDAPAVIEVEIININKIDPIIFVIDFPLEFILFL